MGKYRFYKNNPKDTIYWVDDPETIGVHQFSFDKKKVFNLFTDYPHKLTADVLFNSFVSFFYEINLFVDEIKILFFGFGYWVFNKQMCVEPQNNLRVFIINKVLKEEEIYIALEIYK